MEKAATAVVTCNVWHTECDVMGDQYWVKDEISNPKGIKSKEGHRLDHCGAKDSWYVYLDKYGKPYSMLEMKAGSTNNLIPLPATFYTDATYTELRDPATIEAGERIYWTTTNKGQCWHHTGVTRLDIPNFEFIVDSESYYLHPGESLELDVSAGSHTIIEKYDKDYIINDVNVPFSVDKDGNTVITVVIAEGSKVEVDFENRPKNMPEPQEPETELITESITEPITETETETEQPTEIQTEPPVVITESETEALTETESEELMETETELIVETESELTTETESEISTETEFQSETETEQTSETESETETEVITEKQTEKPTEKQTEKQTEKPTEKQTEAPKVSGAVLGASREREDQSNNSNNNKKKGVQGASRDRVAVP